MIKIEELVLKAKCGNKDAYSELFGLVYKDLYKIALSKLHNSTDAEDAIQDAFINAYQKLYTLDNNRHFKAWIIRILKNKCYRILNKKKETPTSIEDYPSPNFNTDTIHDILDFHNMLEHLNKTEKEIFRLRYEDGLSIKEISRVLNINENTIKTHLNRGKKKLGKSLKPITIMLVLFAFLVTSVIATCIYNYVKELFEISSVGKENDGILMAIENLEWFQDVDMDYIDLGDGYKIKVDYLLMDEMNLYLIFDFFSEKDISKFEDLVFNDLIITNENNDIICNFGDIFSNQFSKYVGDKLIENDSHHIKLLTYMYTDSFPISKKLNISFSKITLAKKLKYKESIYSPITLQIPLLDKFTNRTYTSFSSNCSNVKKAIITETGFYAIISINDFGKLEDFYLTDNFNNNYKCYFSTINHYDTTYNYEYIIFSSFNDSSVSSLKLIINDDEYILHKN